MWLRLKGNVMVRQELIRSAHAYVKYMCVCLCVCTCMSVCVRQRERLKKSKGTEKRERRKEEHVQRLVSKWHFVN